MAVVNKFNVNNKQVTLDADIIENMSANDVSYNDSSQYNKNTVGDKLSKLESEIDVFKEDVTDEVTVFKETVTDQINNYKPIVINGNVTNAPDEEDLTSVDGLLKFKNRSALNGMGYVILRKDKSFSEQVTLSNTIYEIRYDFDLNGSEINIKNNCVLKFNGGSISNGTINGDCFEINAPFFKIFSNIKFNGNFAYNNRVYVDWWISTPLYKFKDYIDQSNEIQECLDCGAENIVFSAERYYYISKTLVIEGEVNLFSTNEIKHYTGHDRAHRKEPPCIHTKEVITMLDYRFLGKLAKGTITIGHLDFVVETPYTDFRDKDTPVIYIHGSEKNNT